MLEQRLIHTVLSRLRHGGLEVTYWDGRTERYGPDQPWVKIRFTTPAIAKAMRRDLELAIGEGYMNGDLEITGDPANLGRLGNANQVALGAFFRLGGKRAGSKQTQASNVQHHYDLGNDFYRLWLDKSMTYSCAYFRSAKDSLEVAQRQKVDHTLRKLNLKRGQRLLDIGSGWGELIIRAAKRYGVKAHGITLSKEQFAATQQRIRDEKLGRLVSVELRHYHDLPGRETYDRIVSVGMYEHVGAGNHADYMATVARLLKPGGVSLLHTITQVQDRKMGPWIQKYIFPGGYIPTLEETIAELPPQDLHTVDVESLRRHYARTLDEWSRRFERHVPEITQMYDERFVRMWRLYLRSSFAAFEYGNLDLHQILFTKGLSDQLPLTREYQYARR